MGGAINRCWGTLEIKGGAGVDNQFLMSSAEFEGPVGWSDGGVLETNQSGTRERVQLESPIWKP